jgi:DNA-binding beta-propeller fold protein YncE
MAVCSGRSTSTLLLFSIIASGGCGGGAGRFELAWGHRAHREGDFIRPRAVAVGVVDGKERIFVVDFTGRIQAFDPDGAYLNGWSTPTIVNGRPAGISWGVDGTVIVADSHYQRVLVYSPQGELLRTIRGTAGAGPGEFAYVADAVQDRQGNFYVVEFGENDRIRKLAPDGQYVKHWGSHGSEPGQLSRPRGAAIGPDELLYVADSCNHRIQVFDLDGNLVRVFGREGTEAGELRYPYDVAIGAGGDIYVAEFGNSRVQRFSPTGESKGVWGGPGREPGLRNSPWGLAIDRRGRVYVMDTENHRVQRMSF